MPTSAGLLVYRRTPAGVRVLLVHPGGPFFRNKDAGAWTIPKGQPNPGEELLDAARREFREETGFVAGDVGLLSLGQVKQKGGKVIHAWAAKANAELDPSQITSNQFEVEYPPRSGKFQSFPEVDRAAFFTIDQAREKINAAQATLLDRLETALTSTP